MTWNPIISGGVSPAVRFKKWNALGDSITIGGGATTNYQLLAAPDLGMTTVYNKGQSGTKIANSGSVADMYNRYLTINSDADLITVFGGTNDFSSNIPMGSITDTVNTTFYGALNIICDGLINKYTNAAIAFFTPTPRSNGTTPNTLGLTLLDYANAIIVACNKYYIPVLDLYRTSGIYASNTAFRTAYIPDGLHPNDAGHQLLAYKMAAFIRTL